MGWYYRDITDSMEQIDRLWFDVNPERELLLRRPIFPEETAGLTDNKISGLVCIQRCRAHGMLHRSVYAFPGSCEKLDLNSDEKVAHAVQLIMADPDGPGN